jgi:hypothetical protein
MLEKAKRRLIMLERAIELPITAERFFAAVEDHMRLTGVNMQDAMIFVAEPFSAEKLDGVIEELLTEEFGANTDAKEEWLRRREAENKRNGPGRISRIAGRRYPLNHRFNGRNQSTECSRILRNNLSSAFTCMHLAAFWLRRILNSGTLGASTA